jgi:hypothetical protein
MIKQNRNAGIPECRMLSLVRHRHSGIGVSPVPLITDYSDSAQLWLKYTQALSHFTIEITTHKKQF